MFSHIFLTSFVYNFNYTGRLLCGLGVNEILNNKYKNAFTVENGQSNEFITLVNVNS